MTKLEALYAQKAGKFAVICALVARELGLGELSAMSDEIRNQVEDEAEQYLEQWAETVEMKTSPTIRPMTPLRRLLSEYHDICERILDEQEIEVGRWAHQRRVHRRRQRQASF
jgi:plasmid stabilization system protein ParE